MATQALSHDCDPVAELTVLTTCPPFPRPPHPHTISPSLSAEAELSLEFFPSAAEKLKLPAVLLFRGIF